MYVLYLYRVKQYNQKDSVMSYFSYESLHWKRKLTARHLHIYSHYNLLKSLMRIRICIRGELSDLELAGGWRILIQETKVSKI